MIVNAQNYVFSKLCTLHLFIILFLKTNYFSKLLKCIEFILRNKGMNGIGCAKSATGINESICH